MALVYKPLVGPKPMKKFGSALSVLGWVTISSKVAIFIGGCDKRSALPFRNLTSLLAPLHPSWTVDEVALSVRMSRHLVCDSRTGMRRDSQTLDTNERRIIFSWTSMISQVILQSWNYKQRENQPWISCLRTLEFDRLTASVNLGPPSPIERWI